MPPINSLTVKLKLHCLRTVHARACESTKRRRKEYVNTTRVLLLWFLVPLVLAPSSNGSMVQDASALISYGPKSRKIKEQKTKRQRVTTRQTNLSRRPNVSGTRLTGEALYGRQT